MVWEQQAWCPLAPNFQLSCIQQFPTYLHIQLQMHGSNNAGVKKLLPAFKGRGQGGGRGARGEIVTLCYGKKKNCIRALTTCLPFQSGSYLLYFPEVGPFTKCMDLSRQGTNPHCVHERRCFCFSSLQDFFPYVWWFRLTKANICIFQNCRISALLRTSPITLQIVSQHI